LFVDDEVRKEREGKEIERDRIEKSEIRREREREFGNTGARFQVIRLWLLIS